MYTEEDRKQLLLLLNNKGHKPAPYSDYRRASAYRMAIDDCYYAIETAKYLQYQSLQGELSSRKSRSNHTRMSIKDARAYEAGVLACKSILSHYNKFRGVM